MGLFNRIKSAKENHEKNVKERKERYLKASNLYRTFSDENAEIFASYVQNNTSFFEGGNKEESFNKPFPNTKKVKRVPISYRHFCLFNEQLREQEEQHIEDRVSNLFSHDLGTGKTTIQNYIKYLQLVEETEMVNNLPSCWELLDHTISCEVEISEYEDVPIRKGFPYAKI